MIDKVDLVFHYGGNWVFSPEIVYNKMSVHTLSGYVSYLVKYDFICEEFTKKLGFSSVEQLLVTGPSGRYYLVTDDEGVKTLQCLFSKDFKVINFFTVDESDLKVFAQNITHHTETYSIDIDVAFEREHSLGGSDFDESDCFEDDSIELDGIIKEKKMVVTDKLEHFKELELGMTFKDIVEARRAVNFYALVNKKGLKLLKTDTSRASYKCAEGYPFRQYISNDKKCPTIRIKTLKDEHTCDPCLKNARADQNTLAQFFKRKVQYNPKYKLQDMKAELESGFDLYVSKSKFKRAIGLALKKLEGSFVDNYNKLEAYGQK
ncbi:hypothetical protein A4A49_52173, partial [Nicotiana attenuata]